MRYILLLVGLISLVMLPSVAEERTSNFGSVIARNGVATTVLMDDGSVQTVDIFTLDIKEGTELEFKNTQGTITVCVCPPDVVVREIPIEAVPPQPISPSFAPEPTVVPGLW